MNQTVVAATIAETLLKIFFINFTCNHGLECFLRV